MSKLLETLREDFLVTVENNGDYQQATSLDGDIIIFDNGEIVDWVIRSATALDIERTKYLNEILSPYF